MPDEKALDLGAIRRLIIAGWTGRDTAAVEKHIRELEAIGVPRPKRTPIFYRGAASLLTTADTIEVLGDVRSIRNKNLERLSHRTLLGSDRSHKMLCRLVGRKICRLQRTDASLAFEAPPHDAPSELP